MTALRAVFDTNIVVSALVFGQRLAWLRRAWANGTAVPFVCRETTDELLRVLRYPKFRLARPSAVFSLRTSCPTRKFCRFRTALWSFP